MSENRVDALSISGIKQLKKLQENNQKIQSEQQYVFLEEDFTHDDLVLYWNKFKERLASKGQMIMASIMSISPIVLEGTTIKYELPNNSSKIDFESEMPTLLGYLRGHLKNHKIKIELSVSESIKLNKILTKTEIFAHLAAKNNDLLYLRQMFDLEM